MGYADGERRDGMRARSVFGSRFRSGYGNAASRVHEGACDHFGGLF